MSSTLFLVKRQDVDLLAFQIKRGSVMLRVYFPDEIQLPAYQNVWDWINKKTLTLDTSESRFLAQAMTIFEGLPSRPPGLEGLSEQELSRLVETMAPGLWQEEIVKVMKEVSRFIPFEKRLLFAWSIAKKKKGCPFCLWLPMGLGFTPDQDAKFTNMVYKLEDS